MNTDHLIEAIERLINSDEIGVDDLLADSMIIKDGINELLAEVKRLRKEVMFLVNLEEFSKDERYIIQMEAEVKRLREENDSLTKQCGALWSITNNWSMCEDDYTMHDQYENLDERYAYHDDGFIILKEMWTLTEEDGWLRNEELEGEEE